MKCRLSQVPLAVAVVGLLAAAAPSQAQVSCTGVAAFASCTAYPTGAVVTYGGSKYTTIAPIPNNRDCPPNSPYNPSNDNWWTNNGTCTGGATATATATTARATATATATTRPTATATTSRATATATTARATATATTARATATATATSTSTATATPTATTSGGGGALGAKVITGYWHNFNNNSSVFKLRDVPTAYNLVAVAFADASTPAGAVSFTLDPVLGYTGNSEFISDITTLHGRGQKVIISVGGQNGAITVGDATAATNFSNSVVSLMNTFGFDGVDIDLENGVSPQYMAQALHSIAAAKPGAIITMAPETIFMQSAGSTYLDLALRVKDVLTIVNTQFYNSGCMLGCDGVCYSQGTENFLTGLACIQVQAGLRGDQIGLGVPASTSGANGGYVAPSVVNAALNCMKSGTSCGTFVPPANGRATLRGAMTWSINWDKVSGYAWVNGISIP